MPLSVPPPEPPVLIQPPAFSHQDYSQEVFTLSSAVQSSPTAPPQAFAPEYALHGNRNQKLASRGKSQRVTSKESSSQKQHLYAQSFSQIATSAAALGGPISIGYFPQQKQLPFLTVSSATSKSPQSLLKANNPEGKAVPQTVVSGLRGTKASAILLTQDREGEERRFELEIPEQEPPNPPQPEVEEPEEETPTVPTEIPIEPADVVEITSDRQEYDEERNVVTAEGNVEMRFSRAVLTADRVQINLDTQIAVAEGNVALIRGDQTLRGSRFEYYFVQDSGVVLNASGVIYQPTAGRDFSPTLANDPSIANIPERPLSDRVTAGQPLQRISTDEGYSFVIGANPRVGVAGGVPEAGGAVNRIRFEADRVDFYPGGWDASNIRLTNDPFSPPELEIQADTAKLRRLGPLQDEIITSNSRLVFDQGFSLPLFRNRFVLDRRPREPGLLSFGFDDDERGGLFAERTFDIINTPQTRWSVTPQYFLQRAVFDEGFDDLSTLGVKSNLDVVFSPRTIFFGSAALTSLDFNEVEDNLRATARLQQIIGRTDLPNHKLSLVAGYRERLFNGSLGFQTVQSNFGAVITSPVISVGQTGAILTYQGSLQYITSDTDRLDLLSPVRDNNRISLTRYQAGATLSRGFSLWRGEALPATPTEGLRYSPVPVQPYLSLTPALTGVTSLYSNGDSQNSLSGSLSLTGQFGHFSRPFLDYTAFNITYSNGIVGDESPFLFDRFVDQQTLSLGLTQQIYGPFRFGLQTSYNLNTGEQISTVYSLEYSRRTYNILVQYNSTQRIGSVSFRVSDFNWTGSPQPFDATRVQPVIQGVER